MECKCFEQSMVEILVPAVVDAITKAEKERRYRQTIADKHDPEPYRKCLEVMPGNMVITTTYQLKPWRRAIWKKEGENYSQAPPAGYTQYARNYGCITYFSEEEGNLGEPSEEKKKEFAERDRENLTESYEQKVEQYPPYKEKYDKAVEYKKKLEYLLNEIMETPICESGLLIKNWINTGPVPESEETDLSGTD